jgi:alcohol dehydrogenase class IV
MKKGEIILATLSIIALGLNLLLIPGGGLLTVLTLSTLSMIYFNFGFALFNDIRLRKILKKDSYTDISSLRILGAVGAGLALSMTTIGLMFKFQSWPGADFNLIAGLLGLVTVTIIGVIKYMQNKSDYYTRILKRVTIFGGLGLLVFLTPKTTWIEFKYRNYPDYANAVKNSIADPDNKELQDKVGEERQKMYDKQDSE